MRAETLASVVLAALVLPVSALPQTTRSSSGKAIYIITNDAKNAVVAVRIGRDGQLSRGTTTETGGAGGSGVDSATNQTAAPDSLFSQSSLTNIFAVNPGSNTVSMLSIDPRDPTKLSLVGTPATLPGEFPVTVAASVKNRLVCVGMTGAKAGVSCASFSANGLGAMDGLRTFDLGQTTPPAGPLNTVSQVLFSSDESVLFATVKGDPTVNNTGFLAAFPINKACSGKGASLAQQGTKSSPNGTAVLFGSSIIPGSSNLFVTDASFGGAVLAIDGQDVASTVGKGVIDGQGATCWATVSPATNTAFVSDVAVNRLVQMSLTDATPLGQIDLSSNGDPGLIDLRAAGNFVYALSPGNGTTSPAVTVVDAIGARQVQHFQLQGLGVSKSAMGMAVLV
ncbi:hypothetical protein CONLIGDRAFT_695437 [Coniochaeta ligniaria NRRL 30616]|uniref:3-carboxymuconate cyclase n=1 Tax=Coniochaeta ligniaria NRRL 30616 TaxID=1408157 RepID=A0A1J7J012_9PEZI|nr:hypothetical protein CONLIGDRAFT_695437 [Coniochaeta ligniaria NRRL 30616]